MFSDLRQFEEAKKWAEEYARTKGNTAQVSMRFCMYVLVSLSLRQMMGQLDCL